MVLPSAGKKNTNTIICLLYIFPKTQRKGIISGYVGYSLLCWIFICINYTPPRLTCSVPITVKPVLRGHSKRRPKIDFLDRLSLNAGQKYCRMLQWEPSAMLWTFIKLPSVIKIFVLSIFEWLLKTGFTVLGYIYSQSGKL